MRCSPEVLVLMRISTSLPDGKWREVADAARAFEELGFDEAAAHEVQHDSFATVVPATLSTHKIGLTTSVAIAFPRSPMIVAILAQDLNVNSNGRFVLWRPLPASIAGRARARPDHPISGRATLADQYRGIDSLVG
jgi:hypothetical protein